MLTVSQRKDLATLNTELSEVGSKLKLTKADHTRIGILQTQIASVRSGMSLQDLTREDYTERAQRAGLEPATFKKREIDPKTKYLISGSAFLTDAQEREARGWQALFRRGTTNPRAWETRSNDLEGSLLNALGVYNSTGGTFCPTEFLPRLFKAMGGHSVLFDSDGPCTVLKSSTGRVVQVPCGGDIENVAEIVGEGSSLSASKIYAPGGVKLAASSYSTPGFQVSYEAMQDVEGAWDVVQMFSSFSADRLARGIGRDLLLSDGNPAALGLIPTLESLGVPFVTASGSSANTGGSEQGNTTVGTGDLTAAFENIDPAYLPNSSWLMSHKTLAAISGIVTKYGMPLAHNFLRFDDDGNAFILGRPVYLDVAMPSLGASNIPIVFGQLDFWVTQLVSSESDFGTGIKVITEANGLVENGLFLLKSFARATGVLAYTDTSSPAPLTYIANHS